MNENIDGVVIGVVDAIRSHASTARLGGQTANVTWGWVGRGTGTDVLFSSRSMQRRVAGQAITLSFTTSGPRFTSYCMPIRWNHVRWVANEADFG